MCRAPWQDSIRCGCIYGCGYVSPLTPAPLSLSMATLFFLELTAPLWPPASPSPEREGRESQIKQEQKRFIAWKNKNHRMAKHCLGWVGGPFTACACLARGHHRHQPRTERGEPGPADEGSPCCGNFPHWCGAAACPASSSVLLRSRSESFRPAAAGRRRGG